MTASRNPSLALDAETLLSHAAWLAKFARALVANEADIDDVVQQTFATALARPPRHVGNLRGWLGTVARNVVRSGARSDNARLAREVAVPPPSPVESPAEAVERAELRRMVVECVLALDEPYRSTVILRFFEEQDVEAIARLTATGENTVRTRIRRGVLRVRELLECKVDERSRGTAHEGVAARALLFARLREIAASAGGPAGAGGGGATGSTAVPRGLGRSITSQATRKAVMSAAVAVVAVGGWWWWKESRTPASSSESASATGPRAPNPPPELTPAASAVGAERSSETATPAPTSTPPAPPVVKLGTVRGIVSDPDGKPASGVRVWAIASQSQQSNGTTVEFAPAAKAEFEREAAGRGMDNWIATASDEDGRFEFANLTTLPGWEIGAFDPKRGAVVSDVVSIRRGHEEVTVDLRLVRGVLVHGKARGEDGAPIGNARVTLYTSFRGALTTSEIVSGAYGRTLGEFDAGLRCGDRLEIECSAPGFATIPRAPVGMEPRATEAALDFCLKRLPGAVVRGRIVSPRGVPLKLEKLLSARFASVPPMDRTKKVSLLAVASDSNVDAPAAGGVTGARPIDGRIDYAEGVYDVVVDAGFRGALELRIAGTVVGTASLTDLSAPPDLVCDPDRLPRLVPSVRFSVRFVDAETREAIDLSKEPYPPQISDGSWIKPTTPTDDDLRRGIVLYGCKPGDHAIRSLLAGHAASLFPVVVPDVATKEPVTIDVPRSDAGIRGTVLHADGSPFAKANVTVYRVTPTGLVDASGTNLATNADGAFQFNLLAKGEHVVVVAGPPDEAPGVARVVATAPFTPVEIRTVVGHATRFRIVAVPRDEEPATTRYRILDGDGVVVDDPHRNWSNATSTFDEFAATLRAGRYVVVVERDGFRDRRLEFDVPAGDTISLALEPLQPSAR